MPGHPESRVSTVELGADLLPPRAVPRSHNRGAIEYLGELYLDLNELPKAEQQLESLAQVCGVACSEYRDLNEQVRRFKAGQPRG
jgi:hypothetical protein